MCTAVLRRSAHRAMLLRGDPCRAWPYAQTSAAEMQLGCWRPCCFRCNEAAQSTLTTILCWILVGKPWPCRAQDRAALPAWGKAAAP